MLQFLVQKLKDHEPYAIYPSGNELWLEGEKARVTPHSYQSMRDKMRRHLLPRLCSQPISDSEKRYLHSSLNIACNGNCFRELAPATVSGSLPSTDSDSDGVDSFLLGTAKEIRCDSKRKQGLRKLPNADRPPRRLYRRSDDHDVEFNVSCSPDQHSDGNVVIADTTVEAASLRPSSDHSTVTLPEHQQTDATESSIVDDVDGHKTVSQSIQCGLCEDDGIQQQQCVVSCSAETLPPEVVDTRRHVRPIAQDANTGLSQILSDIGEDEFTNEYRPRIPGFNASTLEPLRLEFTEQTDLQDFLMKFDICAKLALEYHASFETVLKVTNLMRRTDLIVTCLDDLKKLFSVSK
ncbi:unnamed protein product [Soboliphyme baturini]|uniref:Myb_DNA-bind_2 domain-containing protein n=1 Tax=Soboliphyme baturini TaxID=241478 RepID=A0A183IF72_9BILA|nr:unnamed protein product [Soboliphyme baturini]